MAARLTKPLIELLMNHVENLQVYHKHEDERGQHPAKKVEVDHILHADDILECAGDSGVGSLRVVGLVEFLQVVPAKHGS